MVGLGPHLRMKHASVGTVARIRKILGGQSRHPDAPELLKPAHLVGLHAQHLLRIMTPAFKLCYGLLDFLFL